MAHLAVLAIALLSGFGEVERVPAPAPGRAADISTATLPQGSRRLDLIADVQDPAAESALREFAVFVVRAPHAGCLVAGGPATHARSVGGAATLTRCAAVARRGGSGACRLAFVPVRAGKGTPLRGRCSRPHGTQLRVRVAAPPGRTLNALLGRRARAGAGAFAPAGTTLGATAELVYGWGVTAG